MHQLAAIAFVLVAGCTCGASKSADKTTAAPGAAEIAKAPPLAQKEFYRLDLAAPPTCSVNQPCTASVVLTALAGHKVNDEYPTKFVAEASPDCPVEGKPAFTVEAKTRGVMKIDVKPVKAGTFNVEGTFKLSVCTDDKCEIDSPKISLPITAS